MSNPSKDHTLIRVHAPPGGHSNNIFGTSEFEQSAANKKKHTESDIFGSKKDNTEPAPVAKQNRNTGNNIFGTDSEETHTKTGTLAGQYKQTQMKSNIFGPDEPTSTRTVSEKNRSNIFGIGDNDDPNKRQSGVRQGLRDPNASRMGYNPINGEAYSTKDNVNDKKLKTTVKSSEDENVNIEAAPATTTNENEKVEKPVNDQDNATNGNNAQKNVHTSVRVVHPPGGKSNGPLW